MMKTQMTGRPSFTLTIRGVGDAIVVLEAAFKAANTATETVTAAQGATPERRISLPNRPTLVALIEATEDAAAKARIEDLVLWSDSSRFEVGATIVPGIEAAIAAAQALAIQLAEKAAAAEADAKLYDSLLKRQVDGVVGQKVLRQRARTEKVEGYLPSDWIRFPTPQRSALKGSAKEMEVAEAALAKDVAVVDTLINVRSATRRLNETARKAHANNVPFGSVIAEPDARKVARDIRIGTEYVAEVEARVQQLVAGITVAEAKIAQTKAAFEAEVGAIYARIQTVASKGFRGDIVRTRRDEIHRGNIPRLEAELAILEKNMGVTKPATAPKPVPAAPVAKAAEPAAQSTFSDPLMAELDMLSEDELGRHVNRLAARDKTVASAPRTLAYFKAKTADRRGLLITLLRWEHGIMEAEFAAARSKARSAMEKPRLLLLRAFAGVGKRESKPVPAAPATVAAAPVAAPTSATSVAA